MQKRPVRDVCDTAIRRHVRREFRRRCKRRIVQRMTRIKRYILYYINNYNILIIMISQTPFRNYIQIKLIIIYIL